MATQIKKNQIADGAVTKEKVLAEEWTAWTPTLTASTTNPNLGSPQTRLGRWTRIGKTIFWNVTIEASGTGISAGSGKYMLSLPITPVRGFAIVGHGWFYNGSFHTVIVEISGAANRIFCTDNGAQVDHNSANGGISAAGHTISLAGSYEGV